MRPKFWVAGWMLMVLGLGACKQEAPVAPALATTPAAVATPKAAALRIEKKTEVVKDELGEEIVINTPVFHGIEDPALLKTLQESIAAGVRDATGSSSEEWKAEADIWLIEIDYEVTYNRHDLLSLAYVVAGMGAYPDEMHAYVVADLKTGRRLTAKDLFKPAALEELAAKVDRMRTAAIETAIQEYRPYLEGNQMTEEDLLSTMEPAREKRFGVENLDTFRLDDKGVTFVFDFEFPHVNQALEPGGEFFLSYEELRPYINPEGPLARVIPL